MFIEQQDLKASDVLLQTLARAAEWTTNLVSIAYSPHPRLIPVEAKTVRDLVPRGILRSEDALDYATDHPFRQLIGALYVSQYSGVREFRLDPYRNDQPGTPLTFALFKFPDASDSKAGAFLFRKLEKCELDLTISSNDSSLERGSTNLSFMLAVAKDLRRLAVHVNTWSPGDYSTQPPQTFPTPLPPPLPPGSQLPPFPPANAQLIQAPVLVPTQVQSHSHRAVPIFSRLGLQKQTWAKLRSLSLAGISASGEDILDLIRRHRYTVADLAFRRCSLSFGSWADVVDEVVYSIRIYPFVLDSVDERSSTGSHGLALSSVESYKWKYEGHIKICGDGERSFVSICCDGDREYD